MKVERRRKRIYSFFFCRDASYLIQRCRKSSGMQRACSICIPETHPILFKDSKSRAECKELAQFAFPRRILSYSKMPKVERNAKNLLNLHSRDASYLIQRCRKSSAEEKEFIHFSFAKTHPILFTPLSGFTSCNIAVQQSTNPQFPIIYANILPVDSYNQCNRHVPKHRNKAMAQRPVPSKAFLHFCLA